MQFYTIFTLKNIFTLAIITVCLFLYSVFPAESIFQQITISLTFLLLIPILYIKIVLKDRLKNYGLQVSGWKRGVLAVIIGLIFSSLIIYLSLNYTAFPNKYILPLFVLENFWRFTGYELILVNFFVLNYEFFFRGFTMTVFRNALTGYRVAFFQFLIFITFLFLSHEMSWQMFPYIITSFVSGIIFHHTRSLIYSYLFSLLFIIINDAVFIALR